MAYLGSWEIDDYLTFHVNTHDPSDLSATDADSVPTYRIYEDETGTAIATGSMAKLDDTNTTGFYSERLQLLSATGFERGKQYVVYIEATVSSTMGTISHTFQIAAPTDVRYLNGNSTPVDNLEDMFDGTGYNASASTIGTVSNVSDKTGYSLTSAEHTSIADALLKRDMSSVTGEAARSPINAFRFLRNKWSILDGVLTVTEEDDTTTAWTADLSQDAGQPIIGLDPN